MGNGEALKSSDRSDGLHLRPFYSTIGVKKCNFRVQNLNGKALGSSVDAQRVVITNIFLNFALRCHPALE
ncbi:MAG: hypothetical protein V7K14_21795 [Nostoc sp.]|uniref:hypothetical protein n=1 Tax=unclassified Nostoc TaxID=2593658 RepID=UPI0025F98A0C|nr:hypothetical protein [Nostoc sp. NMS7]MBN3952158.1 hypothetical protein [Nostoc sp. NMS7]